MDDEHQYTGLPNVWFDNLSEAQRAFWNCELESGDLVSWRQNHTNNYGMILRFQVHNLKYQTTRHGHKVLIADILHGDKIICLDVDILRSCKLYSENEQQV